MFPFFFLPWFFFSFLLFINNSFEDRRYTLIKIVPKAFFEKEYLGRSFVRIIYFFLNDDEARVVFYSRTMMTKSLRLFVSGARVEE